VFIALFAIIPLVFAVWLLIRLGKLTSAKAKRAISQGKEAWDDRYARMEQMSSSFDNLRQQGDR
jgi:hypothetical protein